MDIIKLLRIEIIMNSLCMCFLKVLKRTKSLSVKPKGPTRKLQENRYFRCHINSMAFAWYYNEDENPSTALVHEEFRLRKRRRLPTSVALPGSFLLSLSREN